MRSLWNPNRFLRSVARQYWGNPQPTRTATRRIARILWTSTRRKGRKVRPHRFYVPKSNPFWRPL